LIRKITPHDSVSLDFLRGISAQLVLIGHLLSFYGYQKSYNLPIIQNFGVLVFFVLSGFLIVQTSLLKGKSYGFINYSIDRFSRIFYSFLPALLIVGFLDFFLKNYYSGYYNFGKINFLSNLFMLQAMPYGHNFGIESYGTARIFWTVSIEWWFYIFFGILFFYRDRIFKIKLFQYLLLLLSLSFVVYYFGNRGNGLSVFWFIGALMTVVYNSKSLMRQLHKMNRKVIFFFTTITIVGIFIRTYFLKNMYDTALALLLATALIFIFSLASNNFRTTRFSHFSNFLSKYSYSLYLLHYSIIVYTLNYFRPYGYYGILIQFILCNVLAYVFYLCFEKNYRSVKTLLKKIVRA